MAGHNDDNGLLRLKIMGYLVSQAIFAVTELDVVEELVDGPADTARLAERTGADPDALRRFLRVLTAEGLFAEEPAGTFALTPMGALLRRDAPGSLRHFVTLMAGDAYQAWSAATHSLRTGEPAFDVVFGKPMFDWLSERPEASATFNAAQAGLVDLRLRPLLERDWSGAATVVDVGGGNGRLLNMLLSRTPGLRGVLYDLPHVVEDDGLVLADADVRSRCEVVGGDFFRAVPEGGDVYVLAQILHDWDDARATEILRRCREAMPLHARLLILEQVVPDDAVPHPAKLLDLHMLVLLGGRERGEGAWRALLAAAGFEVVRIGHWARSALIEARPTTG